MRRESSSECTTVREANDRGASCCYKESTIMTKQRLLAMKRILLARESELSRDAKHLVGDAMRGATDTPGTADVADLADVGSDCFEQELELGLLENEQKVLEEINDALIRIETGAFGTCEMCNKPLPAARLAAIPYARFCLKCKRKEEELSGDLY